MLLINQERIDKSIVRLKKLNTRAWKTEDKKLIGLIEKLNQEVVIAVAHFACQKCKSEENLQIHHLIMRTAKKFMDFWRYASQRYYWANQICLCNKCHKLYHKRLGIDIGKDSVCITEKRINQIKNKFLN